MTIFYKSEVVFAGGGETNREITTTEMVLAMVGTLAEVLKTIPDDSAEAGKLRLMI